jgi:nucleotide-binding universal stress UspA family protein
MRHRQLASATSEASAATAPARSIPPNRILCATDFSDNSSRAFQTSIRVARACGATLRVLHVAPFDPASRAGVLDAQAGLDERLERFARSEEVADLTISHRVRQGDPAVEIVRASVEDAADLIVLGRHSRVESGGGLPGSVTEAVTRTASCPVIVGAPGAAFGVIRVRHVLCALDLAETSSDTLAYGAGIARALRADLLLLHVASAVDATPTEHADPATVLARFASTVPAALRVRSRVVEGEVYRTIVDQVRENESDLLVVGQHGGDMSPRHYLGGTTLLLLRRAERAVLVVPPRLAGETTAVGSMQT